MHVQTEPRPALLASASLSGTRTRLLSAACTMGLVGSVCVRAEEIAAAHPGQRRQESSERKERLRVQA